MKDDLLECSKTQEKSQSQEVEIEKCKILLTQKTNILTRLEVQLNACNNTLVANEELIKILQLKNTESTTTTTENAENGVTLKTNIKDLFYSQQSGCAALGNFTGVKSIEVPTIGEVNVYCNSLLAGPGWIVIQRRENGKTNFIRKWMEYREGFGNITGEFFIGLQTVHQLTKSEQYELHIQLEDFEGEQRFAHYDRLEVDEEDSGYSLLSLGKYSGNAGDALTHNLHAKFSTYEEDNLEKCAARKEGAWWYGDKCGFSNLNGIYSVGDQIYDYDGVGVFWNTAEWQDYTYSLKTDKCKDSHHHDEDDGEDSEGDDSGCEGNDA
ncbi:GM21989 [Drosophila sechellia]|uniref:GM21989 n=1 Tax=Drosophila sechellia TaxID=7238 RepID=B4HPT3_DROSE|nr:GM21989 [Drosophila sechellia]